MAHTIGRHITKPEMDLLVKQGLEDFRNPNSSITDIPPVVRLRGRRVEIYLAFVYPENDNLAYGLKVEGTRSHYLNFTLDDVVPLRRDETFCYTRGWSLRDYANLAPTRLAKKAA